MFVLKLFVVLRSLLLCYDVMSITYLYATNCIQYHISSEVFSQLSDNTGSED